MICDTYILPENMSAITILFLYISFNITMRSHCRAIQHTQFLHSVLQHISIISDLIFILLSFCILFYCVYPLFQILYSTFSDSAFCFTAYIHYFRSYFLLCSKYSLFQFQHSVIQQVSIILDQSIVYVL